MSKIKLFRVKKITNPGPTGTALLSIVEPSILPIQASQSKSVVGSSTNADSNNITVLPRVLSQTSVIIKPRASNDFLSHAIPDPEKRKKLVISSLE